MSAPLPAAPLAPPAPAPDTRRRRRLGLRHEVLILLPVALLLLAILSTFTLFSYRSSLALLAEERREEAAHAARHAAQALAGASGLPTAAELQRLAPAARGIALLDAAGRPLVAAGELPADLLSPLAGRGAAAVRAPFGRGPDEALPDAVAGFAPLPGPGGRLLRVDLPVVALAGQLRGLGPLTWVVLGVSSALLLLVFFFLSHLLAPYETLLERARQVGEPGAGGEDEVEFVVATFERAVAALAAPARGVEDDIAALERTLSASLQSGLLLLGRQADVLALNPVGAALMGVDPPTAGTPLAVLLSGQPELLALLSGAVAGETGLSREECALRAIGEDGRTLVLGLTVHPLRRDNGGVRGYLVLFADLTEPRRRAEESRLAESLAQLGEMAGGVAHELRNSLATLGGYLTLIERRPDEESVADFLSEIRHETDHLQRVLDDFLAFARPGTARLEEVGLAGLIRRAAADPALGDLPVEVRAGSAEAEAVRLKGDRQLLERALRNLLHNAAQSEREAGRSGPIEVAIDLSPEWVEVTIADRGAGIAAEVRERLFQPFASGRPGGVGLGLPLAHRIVALHGGRLRLEDRPGGGAQALVLFPREPSPEHNRYPK